MIGAWPVLAPLPSLGGHAVFLLLIQIALLLVAARVGGELCRRVALPAVVGELAAGILLGPSVLGHYLPGVSAAIFPRDPAQFHLLEAFGTMGMVLLLLLTGLETDLRLLRHLGRAALVASVMGMVFPFATGFGLGLLTPDAYLAQPDRRILFSFFLATAMAISAMPVIAKILMDLDLTKRNIGVVILSAGVVDDTVGLVGVVPDRRRGLARPCPLRGDAVHVGPDRRVLAVRRPGAVPDRPPSDDRHHPAGPHPRQRSGVPDRR